MIEHGRILEQGSVQGTGGTYRPRILDRQKNLDNGKILDKWRILDQGEDPRAP
jgi:hypothetical protein